MLQFGVIPTSEFLYVIRNRAADGIKAVVHTINMKFGKSKRNNVRILTNLFCYKNKISLSTS